MLDIHPQYLPLSKLLDGRLFLIPEYQRAYSWTSNQRRDLFEDIERVHSKGPKGGHFMAAVVCLRRKKLILGTNEFQELDIVDGQQRITTLIVLLNSIKLALNSDKESEEKLARELRELLVKVEGKELLLLQTNHDSSHHFATFLREGTAETSDGAKTVADRELLKAIEECQEFVSSWTEQGRRLTSLAALLKNRLSFLLHEIAQEISVYTVFEVLNSRGIEVSWLDRLKSILMGAAFELKKVDQRGLIDELHVIWRDIYTVIGLRQGMNTEALRFAGTLRQTYAPSRPLGEQASVDLLRSSAPNAEQIRKIASWLLAVTKACDVVTANPRLNAVTRISQARLLAVAIHLRKDIGTDERKALLSCWENVSFRIYGMLNKDARTRVGDYVRLAWDIINRSLSPPSIEKALKAIGTEFPIEDAVDAMRDADCYEGREGELRYFMFRYEEYLARRQGLNFSNEQWEKIWLATPVRSIEHIWPQSTSPSDVVNRLGNLMLLPPNLNSTLQDTRPKAKIEAYRKTGLLIAEEVATTLETRRWSKKSIKERERTLLEWAATEWID